MLNKSAIALTAILIYSCGFIDLSDIEIYTWPGSPDQVLSAHEDISLNFSDEVDQFSLEAIFKLSGPDGLVEGDFDWIGKKAIFTPETELIPGFRYRLKIEGDFNAADGKAFTKHINIPFYYCSDTHPPLLSSFSPQIAAISPANVPLVLTFSKSMNPESFENYFSFNAEVNYSITWNNEVTKATISPESVWDNLYYHCWNISTDIADAEGIRITEEIGGSFMVQTEWPSLIVSTYPASCNDDGSFNLHKDVSADELKTGEHLVFEFNQAVDEDSLEKHLSFTPSIDGYLLPLSPEKMMYYIKEQLPPATIYTVKISKGLEDTQTNPAASKWSIQFTPDIPALEIVNIQIEDENGIFTNLDVINFNKDAPIDTNGIDYYGTDSLHFIINLSEEFVDTAVNQRRAFESTISLTPVFPPGSAAPSLFSKTWETNSCLRLIYKNISSCQLTEPVYYRFQIREGNAESSTTLGSYLTDSVKFSFKGEIE